MESSSLTTKDLERLADILLDHEPTEPIRLYHTHPETIEGKTIYRYGCPACKEAWSAQFQEDTGSESFSDLQLKYWRGSISGEEYSEKVKKMLYSGDLDEILSDMAEKRRMYRLNAQKDL